MVKIGCTSPLKAWTLGINPDTGKRIIKITSYECPALIRERGTTDNWEAVSCLPPEPRLWFYEVLTQFDEVPCGNCMSCRLSYSRQWANRCMLELQYHAESWFLTLTYDEENVPISYYPDLATGEAMPSMTLRKTDVQKFMKRLRYYCDGAELRYYGAGEYGPSTWRPHYHIIVFGLHLTDLIPYQRSRQGHQYYNSSMLSQAWPFGHIVAAQVTWETCAYTARYVTKKLKGEASEFYDYFGLEHPFSVMSRRPGIARQYYEDHPECMELDYINISTPTGGKKFRPPQYYNRLYDIDYPIESQKLKETKKNIAISQKKLKLQNTKLSYLELLQAEDDVLNNKIKSLERRL